MPGTVAKAPFNPTQFYAPPGQTSAWQAYNQTFSATLFQSGGALATDNFNRANGALGANWGSVTGLVDFSITSNAAGTSNNNNMANRYTAVPAPADQYSKVTLTALNASTNSGVGAAVRIASGAVTMYLIQGNTTETSMFKGVAGSFTQLGSTAAASAVNDVLEIDAVGTTITGKKNGVVIIGPVTDSAIASGDYGIWASAIGFPALSLDNWEGGSPGGGSVATLSRSTGKALTATFSPVAALTRNVAKLLAATLASTVALTKKYLDAGFSATLSFIGNLAESFIAGGGHVFNQSYTATLSFTGAFSKLPRKAFSAILSSSASLVRRVAHAFSATLTSVGTLVKVIRDAGFTAVLSFVGSLTTASVHFFTKAFTATLSFAGTIASSRRFARTLTATLNMTGAIRRQLSKTLAATLSFSAALRKTIRKGFSATLSFVGSLFTGGAVEIIAGVITGALVRMGLAGSSARIGQAGSQLDVRKTTSEADSPTTGSSLRVERTK